MYSKFTLVNVEIRKIKFIFKIKYKNIIYNNIYIIIHNIYIIYKKYLQLFFSAYKVDCVAQL